MLFPFIGKKERQHKVVEGGSHSEGHTHKTQTILHAIKINKHKYLLWSPLQPRDQHNLRGISFSDAKLPEKSCWSLKAGQGSNLAFLLQTNTATFSKYN